jgi:Tfp pilus assembly protein PilO
MMPAFVTRLDLRQLWLLGGGVIAVLAALMSMHAVRPQLKAYRAAVAAESTLQAKHASEPPLEQVLAQENEAIETLGRQLHGEMADVPARELEAVVVGRLQSVSWRHGVELVSVRPSHGEQVEMFEELLFDVELDGHYGDLYAWLQDLHGELGFVVIKNFAVARADEDASTPTLRATLTLAAYRALGS